jgi:hypothetical protein
MPPGLQISATNVKERKYHSSLNSGVVQIGRKQGESSKAERGTKFQWLLIWPRLSAIIDLHPCKYEKHWEDKKSVGQFKQTVREIKELRKEKIGWLFYLFY